MQPRLFIVKFGDGEEYEQKAFQPVEARILVQAKRILSGKTHYGATVRLKKGQ